MRSLPSISTFSGIPLVLLLSLRLTAATGYQQCYYPDGSIPTDYIWTPCTGEEFSSCCIPGEGDVCQPNGLCWYPPFGEVFRGACTDRTWNSPSCPKDICVDGVEDTWAWAKNCRDGSGDKAYVCGNVTSTNFHNRQNCSAGATPLTDYVTTSSKTAKPTRYTPPASVDTSLYSVITSEYTATITASIQSTIITTTWQSTFTSALSQEAETVTVSTTTGTARNGQSGTAVPVNGDNDTKGKISISPGTLAGAVAGPIVVIAILAGLLFWLRKKHAAKKKGLAGGARLDSADDVPPPPPNGPVGAYQTTPYEVPASEAKPPVGGVSNVTGGVGDKHVYTGVTRRADDSHGVNAYEMENTQAEKLAVHHNAHEVSGDATPSRATTPIPGHAVQNGVSPITPRQSPAPGYSQTSNGPVVMPVELYGDSQHYGR